MHAVYGDTKTTPQAQSGGMNDLFLERKLSCISIHFAGKLIWDGSVILKSDNGNRKVVRYFSTVFDTRFTASPLSDIRFTIYDNMTGSIGETGFVFERGR